MIRRPASSWRRRAGLLAVLTAGILAGGLSSTPAQAHPLNNFSINQHHALTLHQDRLDDRAVIDLAEIPTLQQKPAVDTDGDGTFSVAERTAYAQRECTELSRAVGATVDGTALSWQLGAATLEYLPGEKGLQVARIECGLSAPADLDAPAQLRFETGFRAGNVGWREIIASGQGVRLIAADVAERSISDELRAYPDDLLASPLDQRSATLSATPGSGSSPGVTPRVDGAGPISRALAPVNDRFDDLLDRDLTVPVGLAALALSIMLGAAHAAMPGHGKTVMAAYLVGRHGGPRDALLVGATVTATHTGGVLGMGLLLSATAAVSGDGLLAWLGLISGALIAVIGVALLRSAWRHRGPDGSGFGHGHGHGHGHDHSHGHDHAHSVPALEPARAPAGGNFAVQTLEPPGVTPTGAPDAGHDHPASAPAFSRRGLVGLGVAGGLVPSPSALIVLLGAVALGRTWFGVALVFGYGIGMAATLITAGLLLVRLRDRVGGLMASRPAGWFRRLSAVMPSLTAVLVIAVGVGLMINELPRI